jgi:molecular chaperone GrpE
MSKKKKENGLEKEELSEDEAEISAEVEAGSTNDETNEENGSETASSQDEVEEEAIEMVMLSAEELTELRQQFEDAEKEAAANMDGWQRTQAEFVNYKKRIEREQDKMREDAAMRVIKRYLDVLDDLNRALENKPEDGDGAVWAEGIQLIQRKLMNILESEGVTIMEAEGQEFDPNLHEAIAQEDSPDHESGQIIEVIQHGYMIGERVLRPAVVRVAS